MSQLTCKCAIALPQWRGGRPTCFRCGLSMDDGAKAAQEVEPSAPAASFPEMEVRATVALDGGTRRACNNENCSNDYPCSRHTEFGEGGELPLPEQSAAGMGLTGQCDGQPQGNTHPLSNEPSPSGAASGQAGKLNYNALQMLAENKLESPIGAHTIARVTFDEWTFTTEELVDLMVQFAQEVQP